MKDEANRTSVSAQRKGGTDPSADFERDREHGKDALREMYGAKVNGDIEEFTRVASLVDLMLLHEVLLTWRGFALRGEEKTVLAGAMAELFCYREPDGGTSSGEEKGAATHATA
jgi:hypothetical protein